MSKTKKSTSVDILQLTSSEVFNDINKIDFKNKYKYSGSLPDSLMLRKLRSITKKSEFRIEGIHEYTNIIIDVDLSKDAYETLDTTHNITINKGKDKGKVIAINDKKQVYTAKAIRKKVYNDGIKIQDINSKKVYEYVNFLRGSNKSKTGQCLFILKDYYDKMINWCRMAIIFNNKKSVDIASIRAYESLVCSSIEDTIIIDPNRILLIDDVKGYCQEMQSVTSMVKDSEGKELINVETKMMDIHNDIFDGQSLGSSELFKQKSKNGKQQGFYLLRNHMLKTAMFNTNIQKFYQDENITTVHSMFDEPMDAKEVLLIITPNSCKFFKFKKEICMTILSEQEYKKIENDDTAMKKIVWDYWKEYISDVFGICQTEHESKYIDGSWSKSSYQFLNTMPFTSPDLETLSKPCVDDLNLLATNLSVLRDYIGADQIDLGKNLMYNLLCVNDKAQYLDMFYSYRQRVRNDYAKELKRGRLLLRGDYSVVCSNPYEMLLASTGKKITQDDLLHNRIDLFNDDGKSLNQYIYPIYCRGYKPEQELCLLRSPHIASGNVAIVKNIHKTEFDKYFSNFNKNIVIIDSYDCGILDRCQGMDMDSDKCIIFTSDIMVERGKECLKYPTPVNKIDANKDLRRLTPQNMAIIDNKICGNAIGIITNFSMKYNSYFWHYYNKNFKGEYDEKLQKIYDVISCASSLAGSEIDKSKKLFSFSAKNILKELESYDLVDEEDTYMRYEYNYNQTQETKEEVLELKKQLSNIDKSDSKYVGIESQIKELTHNKIKTPKLPMFFKNIFDTQTDAEYSEMDCPMNNLTHILKKNINKAYRSRDDNGEIIKMSIKDILSDIPLSEANTHQIKPFAKIAKDLKKSISAIYVNKANEDKREVYRKVNNLKSKALEEISNKIVKPTTIASILYRAYAKEDFKYEDSNGNEVQYGFVLLSLLAKAYPNQFAGAIQCNKGSYSELIEFKYGDIERFGKIYVEADTNFMSKSDNKK